MKSGAEIVSPKIDEKKLIPSLWNNVFSFLSRDDLISVSTMNQFFNENTRVATLLDLITQYKLTKSEANTINYNACRQRMNDAKKTDSNRYKLMYEDKVVKNPILIAIDALLKKDPSIAFEEIKFMDASKRPFRCTALEYVIITYNFPVRNIIRGYAKTIRKEHLVDECINKIFMLDSARIEPQLFLFNSSEDIADRIIIWPRRITLPQTIPFNAILIQPNGDTLFVFTMKEEKLVNNAKIKMTEALKNINEKNRYDTLRILADTQPSGYITLGDDPVLFNRLRELCQLPPLPFTQKMPALIKHQQAEFENVLFWGKQSGKWQLQQIPSEYQERFLTLFNNSSQKIAKLTPELEKILKEYHSEYIELAPYFKGVSALLAKYPYSPYSSSYWETFDSDIANYIGRHQILFPAWIMQFWYTYEAFFPIPDFNELIITASGTDRLEIEEKEDVYDSRVGVTTCLLKPSGYSRFICCFSSYVSGQQVARSLAESDFNAMKELNNIIESESKTEHSIRIRQ